MGHCPLNGGPDTLGLRLAWAAETREESLVTSVFVSYRRDDAKHAAGRLGERLDERFRLFMDIDNIPAGADFTAVVRDAVDRADVLVAVIGNGWLSAVDSSGARRIDKPEDWVALEVGTALQRGIPVVPVLVDGARMPRPAELPSSLIDLSTRQAIRIAHETFAADSARLMDTIERIVGGSETSETDLWTDPDYPAARSASLLHQWATAAELLERVRRRHPKNQQVLGLLENAGRELRLVELGERASAATADARWGAAVDALEELNRLDPSDEIEQRLVEARERFHVQTLQAEMHNFAAGHDWEAVLALDATLSELEPSAADFDDLATYARAAILQNHLAAQYVEGLKQLEAEDWEGGEATFAALVAEQPDYGEAQRLLGVARHRGRPDQDVVPSGATQLEQSEPDPEPVGPPSGRSDRRDTPGVPMAEAETEQRSNGRGRVLVPILSALALIVVVLIAIAVQGDPDSDSDNDSGPAGQTSAEPPETSEPSPTNARLQRAQELLTAAFPDMASGALVCGKMDRDGAQLYTFCDVPGFITAFITLQVYLSRAPEEPDGGWGPGCCTGTWGTTGSVRIDKGRVATDFLYQGGLFELTIFADNYDEVRAIFETLHLLPPGSLPAVTWE